MNEFAKVRQAIRSGDFKKVQKAIQPHYTERIFVSAWSHMWDPFGSWSNIKIHLEHGKVFVIDHEGNVFKGWEKN